MKKKYVLFSLFVITILVAVYSALTVGQSTLHSDTATATLLAQSQMKHRQIIPSTWAYVNGDVWLFSLNVFVLPFTAFMKNQVLARCFGSILMLFFVAICMILFSRTLMHDNSWLISIPLFLICLLGNTDMILYQSAYSLTMGYLCLGCTFTYHAINHSKSFIPYFGIFVLLFLLCGNGIRFIAELVLPLIGTIVLYRFILLIKNKSSFSHSLRITLFNLILLILPSSLGYILYKLICRKKIVYISSIGSANFSSSPSEWKANLLTSAQNALSDFGFNLFSPYQNMIALSVCVLFLIILPIAQLFFIKKEKSGILFFMLFTLMHNCLFFVLAVFCGKTQGRWLLTSIYLCILLSAHFISKNLLGSPTVSIITITLFSVILLSNCAYLIDSGKDWKKTLDEKKQFAQQLEDLNVTKGYATYWNAYSTELYTNSNIRFGGILVTNEQVECYRALVDTDVFTPSDQHTFLMLSQEETDILGDSINVFGSPVYTCSIDEMNIFIYDYDIVIYFNDWMADLLPSTNK